MVCPGGKNLCVEARRQAEFYYTNLSVLLNYCLIELLV